MKRNGVLSFLAAICFLAAGVSLAMQLYYYLQRGITSPLLTAQGLQMLCLLLTALDLAARRSVNARLALYAGGYVLVEVYLLTVYGRGSARDSLTLLPWAAMAVVCLLARDNGAERTGGKKALLFLPAILSGAWVIVQMRRGTLSRAFAYFTPRSPLAWSQISPAIVFFGFVFFGLWAVSGGAPAGAQDSGFSPPRTTGTMTGTVPMGDTDRIIRQYKGFLDAGIITRAEFDAKMRSLRKR